MQPSTMLLALAASASASILPLDARASNAQDSFNITNFYVNSIHAAGNANYVLNVTYAGASTQCQTTTIPTDSNKYCGSKAPFAPAIDGFVTRSCADPAFTWGFVKKTVSGSSGYQLSVQYKPSASSSALSACRFVPESNFFCFSQGDTHGQDGESKKAPVEFTVGAVTGSCA